MIAEPYIGEIRAFAYGQLIQEGWLRCDGQILNTNACPDLFSLLGDAFGGNGTTTFALPKLNGRTIVCTGADPTPPVHQNYDRGDSGGHPVETIITDTMPAHTHNIKASSKKGSTALSNSNDYLAELVLSGSAIPAYAAGGANVHLYPGTIIDAGGGEAHENRMPYLAMTYCIAVTGIYPSPDESK